MLLETLRTHGAVCLEDWDELLYTLQNDGMPERHTSHGYSGRVIHHSMASPNVKSIIQEHGVWDLIRKYFGCDPQILRVQRIECTSKATTQLVHRDHDMGPCLLVALAVSDRRINTVVFEENNSNEEPTPSDNFTRLSAKCGVFDTYFYHSMVFSCFIASSREVPSKCGSPFFLRKITRWKPNAEQVLVLQREYEVNPLPSKENRVRIASRIDCSERRVQVWFQNKRQRECPQNRTQPPIPVHDFASNTLELQSVHNFVKQFEEDSSFASILNIAATPTMDDIFSINRED